MRNPTALGAIAVKELLDYGLAPFRPNRKNRPNALFPGICQLYIRKLNVAIHKLMS
jgi:hypothetical protein